MFLENGTTVHTALNLLVANRGSQGLIDIALSPRFSKDKFIYLYLTPSQRDGDYSGSKIINRYSWDALNGKLIFDETVFSAPKAKKDIHVDGLITFDAKGRPFISPASKVGPNVGTMNFHFAAGASGTMTVVHPGLQTLNPKAIGLMPVHLHPKGSGTLNVSGTNVLSNVSVSTGIGSFSLQAPVIASNPTIAPPVLVTGSSLNLAAASNATVGNGTTVFVHSPVTAGLVTLISPITGVSLLNTVPILPASSFANGTIATYQSSIANSGAVTLSDLANFGTLASNDLIVNGDVAFSPNSAIRIVNAGTATEGVTAAFRSSFSLNDLRGIVSMGSIDSVQSGTITVNNGSNVFNNLLAGGTTSFLSESGATLPFGTIGLSAATVDLSNGIAQMNSGTLSLPLSEDMLPADMVSPNVTSDQSLAAPTVMPASLGTANTPEPSTALVAFSVVAAAFFRRRQSTPSYSKE